MRELFTEHRGRLTDTTRLTADIALPELATDSFVDLYPLLPYQIDLIINVVSGLRTAGGATKHVGGANRTIIKLAQQLLIHPQVALADAELGALARIDQIYDLAASNITSEVRGKIAKIEEEVDHPLAQPVAKAICLLQYVQSIHRTAENIAATLQPSVDCDSLLSDVKAALDALERAHKVRLGDDGYRIPSPAEDDWERQRAGLSPKPGEVSRLHSEVVNGLWQPQPSHTLQGVKAFKAGLYLNGRQVVDGDIDVHLTLAEPGEHKQAAEDLRKRSQSETKALFWVAALDEAIDRETVELFRSKEILSRKERGAQTKDESALVAEEKRRQRRHQEELRRLLKQALLGGSVLFRGNDRSPGSSVTDVGKAAAEALSTVLPEVFDRYSEAAARVAKKDLEVLMKTENLLGLTPVFTELKLVGDEAGKPVLKTDSGPLAEVLARIEDRTSYGEKPTGRYLAEEFAKEPFGWDFDAVRLFVVALIRAGKIQATSKGQPLDTVGSLEAQSTFPNNNLFRQASFQPKVGIEFSHVVDAAENFKAAFGKEVDELEQGAVARQIHEQVERHEEEVRETHTALVQHSLPGADVLASALDQMSEIRKGSEAQIILTFNASHKELKEAIKRSAELEQALTKTRLENLVAARRTLDSNWKFLASEPDLADADREHAEKLRDMLGRETFFRELSEIEQHANALEVAYSERREAAVDARRRAYEEALITLHTTPGWEQLDEAQQEGAQTSLADRASGRSGTFDPAASGANPVLRARAKRCDRADAHGGRWEPSYQPQRWEFLCRRHRDGRTVRGGSRGPAGKNCRTHRDGQESPRPVRLAPSGEGNPQRDPARDSGRTLITRRRVRPAAGGCFRRSARRHDRVRTRGSPCAGRATAP